MEEVKDMYVKDMYFEELENIDELDAAGVGAAVGIGYVIGLIIYVGIAT